METENWYVCKSKACIIFLAVTERASSSEPYLPIYYVYLTVHNILKCLLCLRLGNCVLNFLLLPYVA